MPTLRTNKKLWNDVDTADDSDSDTDDSKTNNTEISSDDNSDANEPKNIIRRRNNEIAYEQDENIDDIKLKKINDEYSRGQYGDFNVIIMNKNRYINATQLCHSANKYFKHWNANKESKELIRALSKLICVDRDKLIIIVKGGNIVELRGTYVHPKLITHIAIWASVDFALKVSDIVNEYLGRQAIDAKNKLLKIKDDKIDIMSKKIDKLLEKNDDIGSKLKQIKNMNRKLMSKQDRMSEKLDSICDNRVILTGKKNDDNHLLIIKNNYEPDSDDDDDTDIYEYTVLKMQKSVIKPTIEKRLIVYPNLKIILDVINPNARTLWKNIKLDLKKKIDCKNSSFNLKKNYSQKELIKDIKKIHERRFEYDSDSEDD